MNKNALIILGLVGGAYVWAKTRPKIDPLYLSITDIETGQTNQTYSIVDTIEEIGDYIMETATGQRGNTAMRNVNRGLLNNPNIRAFLAVIRRGEGTSDAGGYNRLFGGGTFSSYAAHPNILVSKSGYKSTAAGAYQFLKSTWDETAQIMGLRDFSPASQDIGALGRLAYRGAIEDIIAGRFTDALKKTGKEWASLPYSPYGQPVISFNTALAVYKNNGGNLGVIV